MDTPGHIENENSELKGFGNNNPFSVPENYFESLPGKILARIEAAREIKALSPTLSQIEKKNPFRVPENYFNAEALSEENLSEKIRAKICSGDELEASTKNPFKIPESYFDGLQEKIQRKIEQKEGSLVLLPLEKTDFKIPPSYFEHLPGRINQRISEREAKTISFRNYYNKYKYSAIAVAAAVAAIIAMYFFYPSSPGINEREMFVSADEISNSFYLQEIDEATLIEEISESSLEEISDQETPVEEYLLENGIDEIILIDEL